MRASLLNSYLCGALLLSPATVLAVADIRGEVSFPDGPVVPPGSVGRLVFTVTNDGPDTAVFVGGSSTFVITQGSRTYEIFQLASTAPCTMIFIDFFLPPPQLSSFGVSIHANVDLAPGESVSCEVGITTFPESPTPTIVTIGVGSTSPDPDRSNNVFYPAIYPSAPPAQVQRPTVIPVGGRWAWIALSLMLIATAVVGFRRTAGR